MKNALKNDELATLCTVLLDNLDEVVFFSKLSGFFHDQSNEYKVQAYESLSDGSTILRAENGKAINESQILAKGIGLSGYVARMKRAYYSNTVKRDPITAHSKRDDVVEAELCVPVMSEGFVVGTIHIQSINKARQFSEQDIDLVNSMLKELKAPIRNIRLYLMAKNLNRELEAKLAKQDGEVVRTPELKIGTQSDERINLLGISSRFLDVIQNAKKLALQDFPILLEGAHGTGKKILARKIHFWSHRKNNPCVLVHCTSISEAALDAELFGKKGKKGAMSLANGGTLVLDDIGSLSLSLQAKILRAMMTGECVTSDNEEKIMINIRLIATSKIALADKVKNGEFKEELYYRLNTMNLRIPLLKDRVEDIKVLAEHFINDGKPKEQAKLLTSACLAKFSAYHWPGNIQELRQMMERLSTLVEGTYIDEQHLPELKSEEREVKEIVVASKFIEVPLHDLEKKHIMETLEHLNGNKTRAAKSLGITVKTLYNKLHSYGMIESKEQI